jgi:hypothetical protein
MAVSKKLPPVYALRQDDTHRLIPSRYAEASVLSELTDGERELDELFELDGATNDRLLAEAYGLPGIEVRELVFGIANDHIVNAAFTHPHATGSRFNDSTRGAWYAAFELETSIREISHHRGKWLAEVRWEPADWNGPQSFEYTDMLADFRADFHDIRGKAAYRFCLVPNDYAPSQVFANRLLAQGSAGILYPSVRHTGHDCVVCFRPALVMNVRKGCLVTLEYESPDSAPAVKVAA